MFLGHYRAAGVEITFVENLVDIVWGADRPARPCVPAMIMPANLHGNPATEKIRAVRQAMTANKCEVHALFRCTLIWFPLLACC